MNRRTVVKNLALLMGGAVLLPSCLNHDGTSYIQLKHIAINDDQQKLIGEICETIIPKTSTPGAKDLHLPAFVLKMLDDCYDKKGQEAFMKGMGEFTDLVKKKYNSSFSDLSNKDREAVLTDIENSNKLKAGTAPVRRMKPKKNMDAAPINAFYWSIKQQTIFGYTTSQYFMTKQIFYDMVPGRYIVHFPVSKLKLKLV
jgi:Gluconate 2-dehydrogenase subunit 3